jgi:hypothetical protein
LTNDRSVTIEKGLSVLSDATHPHGRSSCSASATLGADLSVSSWSNFHAVMSAVDSILVGSSLSIGSFARLCSSASLIGRAVFDGHLDHLFQSIRFTCVCHRGVDAR